MTAKKSKRPRLRKGEANPGDSHHIHQSAKPTYRVLEARTAFDAAAVATAAEAADQSAHAADAPDAAPNEAPAASTLDLAAALRAATLSFPASSEDTGTDNAAETSSLADTSAAGEPVGIDLDNPPALVTADVDTQPLSIAYVATADVADGSVDDVSITAFNADTISASSDIEPVPQSAVEPRATVLDTAANSAEIVPIAEFTSTAIALPEPHATTVVFIDAAVTNKDALISSLGPDSEIVILDANRDGVAQIADYLSGRTGVDSVQILSHGDIGRVYLGNAILTTDSVSGNHADELATIKAALSDNADILLYGCDVAAGSAGKALVDALAGATDADIGASIDETGSTEAGGDWVLELQTGYIESSGITVDAYTDLLAPISIANVNGSSVTATTMAQLLAGGGITITGATYTGANSQSGIFSSATGYSPDWISFSDGIVLTTGTTTGIAGANTNGATSTDAPSSGSGADTDLAAIGAGTSFDSAVLSFNFVPTTNQISLQFVFGSEEYNEYVYSTFNDAMGIWVNGVNVAVDPSGTPISIDTINRAAAYNPSSGSQANDPDPANGTYDSSAPNIYINNAPNAGTYSTGMDGFTVTLSIIATVTPGVSNSIKIGIADIGDQWLDSYLFVKAGSLVGVPTAYTDNAVTGRDVPVIIDPTSNDLVGSSGPLTITHVADKPITAGGAAVVFATGSSVTLGLDGKLTYTPAPGATGDDLLTYTVADGNGKTAVGYIDIQVLNTVAPTLDLDTVTPAPSGTAEDHFLSNNYSNSTGTIAWNGAWQEIGDDGSASSGDVFVTTDGSAHSIEIRGGTNGIQRSVNLTTYDKATLSFDYRRSSFDTFSDYVDVLASSDGVTFTQIGRLQGPANDTAYGTFSTDLTSFISSNTTIKFVSSSGFSNNDLLFVDNVTIAGNKLVTGHSATFVENGSPVSIAAMTANGGGIADIDSTNLSGASITLTNAQTADSLSVSGSLPTGITATVSSDGSHIVLSGTASKAAYQTAIEAIVFKNTSDTPATVTRNIEVTVTDNTGLVSNTAVASIGVTAVNDAPVAAGDTFSTPEDTPVTFDVRTNDTDVDSASLNVTHVNGTSITSGGSVAVTGGSVTLNAGGTLTFTPTANWNGAPSFTYTVSDGSLTSTATVSGTVSPVNDAPTDLIAVPGLPESNLTGFYAFTAQTNLGRDDAGDDAPITIYGTAGETVGPNGSRALDLTGGATGPYGDISGITTGGPMTIAGTVRFDSTVNWERIVDFGQQFSSGAGNIYIGREGTSNNLTFTIETNNGSVVTYRATATNAIVNGQWINFAASVDASGNMKLYVNGTLAASATGTALATTVRTNNFIGRSNWEQNGDGRFDGAIDNILIANRTMSATEIAAFTNQSSGFTHRGE